MLAHRKYWLLLLSVLLGTGIFPVAATATLEESLVAEPVAALAAAAAQKGDAARGAVAFFRAEMACNKCHVVDGQNSVGPDLAKLDKKITNAGLVESVLFPSKAIAQGYQPVSLELKDGRTLIGLVVRETDESITLRHADATSADVTVAKSEIEQRTTLKQSIMPAGQVNQLANRKEFLDLVRYLMELRDGGARRAHELKPAPQLVELKLPEYEKRVDHAGMIRSLGNPNYDRGATIYLRLCINCHGTKDQPGSLPTALRFASGKFKNGTDPYAMYQTLTSGFGMMTPQTWMVPQQKYDVIHYIREEFLEHDNKSQHFAVTRQYLDGLPRGDTRGPEPKLLEPWREMNYGPSLTNVYEFGKNETNFAYKGIAVRLDHPSGAATGDVTHGSHWMVFDHDTFRIAGGWHGQGFIDFAGIQFDGQHVVHAHTVGQTDFENPPQPGWGNVEDASFNDPRIKGTDGRHYGPLPRPWAHFHGYYYQGNEVVFFYKVGTTGVLEHPGMVEGTSPPVYTRTFNIGPRAHELILQIARCGPVVTTLKEDASGNILIARPQSMEKRSTLVCGASPKSANAQWISTDDGNLRLRIPAGDEGIRLTVWIGAAANEAEIAQLAATKIRQPDRDLVPLTRGGPPHWPQRLKTHQKIGADTGPFAVDVLAHPVDNPWNAQSRFTGLDFLPDGDKGAVCTWDGDVWLVSGLSNPQSQLTWQRIASGLFQPLGLKVIKGKIYVTCRDQIVVLNDLNGDGETDFYECFNNDQQVTAHFHEFAMGLQTDAAGNLYYAKAACHARPALVPQHGTLLRVSPNGQKTDILARGFRAPNGVCLNPDGTFFMTDQEGHWLPKNRINHVVPGGFYGNMMGYGAPKDSSDTAMEQPLCWITNTFDRSPAEMLWVTSPVWKPLQGSLLNLSYGYGKVFVVPHEVVDGKWQGGMCELPIPALPTGIIRGRFHPQDGQLYACGMFAWAGSATQPGGLYRIRYAGRPACLPIGLKARQGRMEIRFSGPLDESSVAEAANYGVRVWALKRSARYGSDHINEHPLKIKAASLGADGRTVNLELPELAPTRCMEIKYDVKGKDGTPVVGKIHNTIHALAK